MSKLIVLYDACVLYPAPIRDLLVELAITDLFRAKWTDEIHEEWIRNLTKPPKSYSRQQLEYTKELMNDAVLDCLVADYKHLEKMLNLPDKNDHHVLAAAIAAQASIIVTFNLKDFPSKELSKHEIEAWHPDDFLIKIYELDKKSLLASLKRIRKRLKNPPKTVEEYLLCLHSLGLRKSTEILRGYMDKI